MRIKLLQLLAVIVLFPLANAWAQAELQLSAISFAMPNTTLEVKDQGFQLNAGKAQENLLVSMSDGTAKVTMETKIKRLKSRISQHKAQGIRLTSVYYCTYKNEKRKNKTERIFWPDKNDGFVETVSFSFNKGKLKSEVLRLKFNGKINFF